MENAEKIEENQKTNLATPVVENERTIAIIAYMTFVGWIIALIMNNDKKNAFASFHIRQMLGICCLAFGFGILSLIPFLGWFIYVIGMIFSVLLWLIGLIGALNNKQKPILLVGDTFQEWFKNIL